jgi:outer membrane protein TolC
MNLQTSKVRMKLAEASVAYASEGLDQSMERQRLGTAIPLEVIRAQEQMMEAKLDLIDAVTQYNKAQYSLYIALGNNP